jgi:hypothetical protein
MTSPTENRVEPRPEPRAYTSPYDTAAHGVTLPSVTPDPRSVPTLSAASTPAQGFHAINSPTPVNGVVSRESSVAQESQQTHVTPQAIPQLHPQPQGSPQNQAAQVNPTLSRHRGLMCSYISSKRRRNRRVVPRRLAAIKSAVQLLPILLAGLIHHLRRIRMLNRSERTLSRLRLRPYPHPHPRQQSCTHPSTVCGSFLQ